jgi:hypothetical protein
MFRVEHTEQDASMKADAKQSGFQQTTRRYIPEDRTLHNNRCENLKTYKDIMFEI